jgi:pectin methylesterase-like acyl-CoA thioesterase
VYDAVVAADGSGNYKTVQQAINAMPDNRTLPWLIFVKNGIYNELVRVPSTKAKLHLIGQDKEKTIIQYKINYAGTSSDLGWEFSNIRLGVADGSTVVVDAPDFFTENISYINSWGYGQKSGPQALALISNGDRIVVNNCKLLSYQDTWKTTSYSYNRGYSKNCFIEGAVDFIYSSGDYYFDNCTLNINRTSGGYIVAPSHDASSKWGYIFMNCSIIAPTYTTVYLGRPWHNAPKTSFVNTTLGRYLSIYPVGWYEQMGGIPAIFADYNTRNYLGDAVDLSKRINYYWFTDSNTGQKVEGYAQKTLTPEQVASYTVRNVLSGSDTWHPDEKTVLLNAPEVSLLGDKLSWPTVPYAICYALTRNDSIAGFTTDSSIVLTQPGVYKLQAVNEFGGLSNFSSSVTKTLTGKAEIRTESLQVYIHGKLLHVEGLLSEGIVQLYSMNGVLLEQFTLHENAVRSLNRTTACLIRFSNQQGVLTLKYLPN